MQYGEKPPLIIKNLDSLLLYVQSLNDSHFNRSKYRFDFGYQSKHLIEIHNQGVCMYVDKYIQTADPCVQTQFLLESCGFNSDDYDAWLDDKGRFWFNYCNNNGVESVFISPNVKGSKYNPYVRFVSSKISGGIQTNKLLDLVGLNIKHLDYGSTLVNLMVFTYPKEVSYQLLVPNKRNQVIKKMKLCWKKMFKEFRLYFGLDSACILGCSESLHLWSSSFPVLPHPHHHVVFPHLSFLNVTKEYREDCETLYSDVYNRLYETDDKKERTRLQVELSNELKNLLYFELLPKEDNNLPLDIGLVKFIWSEIVNEVFGFEAASTYDVFTEFVKSDNRAKILHYMQYKNRPPILDLDLFFRKCPDIISNYDKVNFQSVIDYIQSLFVTAVMKEDINAVASLENMLKNAEKIFSDFSEKDIVSWLKFLCNWKTDTTVLGFWRNIKRYRVTSSIRGELPNQWYVCPICGGDYRKEKSNSLLYIDFLVIHLGSRFRVVNVKGPPVECFNKKEVK